MALELEKEFSCLELLSVSLLVQSSPLNVQSISSLLYFKRLRRSEANVCEYKNCL